MTKDNSAVLCLFLGLAAWIGNTLYALGEPAGLLKQWSPAIVAGAMIAFFIVHGRRSHSGRRLFLFTVTVFLVGWFFETVSVVTDFPFGNYHYTEIMGPFLGHVPVSVMPAYCVMGYASWSMARLLLGRTDRTYDSVFRYGTPIIAAGLMVVWDLSMDPLRATLEGRWVWLDGGTHFGVPLINFLGWAYVTWIMFQIFALYVSDKDSIAMPLPPSTRRLYWLSVPLVYSAFAGEYLLNPIAGQAGGIVMINGIGMPVAQLYGSVAYLTATTMLPLALMGVWAALCLDAPRSAKIDDEAGELVSDSASGEN